jgi:imidazolonepropionase-like amidohydrolase
MLRSVEVPWAPRTKPQSLLLKNVSLVDVRDGSISRESSILLSNGRISKLSTATEPMGDVDFDRAIDIGGKFICPGLIDCHVHVTATPGGYAQWYDKSPSAIVTRTTYVLRQMLLRGYTTVRDTGGCDAGIRSAVSEGVIPGPRLFIAGQAISQTGGHADFRQAHQGEAHKCCGDIPALGRVCDGVPACLEATRDELRKGADFIKIMCGGGVATPTDHLHMIQFTAEEIRAITTTAKFFGTYVTAHAYTSASIRHAVDNGVLGIEHANLIDLETAKYCAEKGVIVTHTLSTYHSVTIPPFNRVLTEVSKPKFDAVAQAGIQSLRYLKEAGVMVCYGSDLLGSSHFLQSVGFRLATQVYSPAEILKSATVNAAKLLRKEGELGVIAENAFADLLILEANPLDDISILENPDKFLGIIKEGRVVSSRHPELVIDTMYGALQGDLYHHALS